MYNNDALTLFLGSAPENKPKWLIRVTPAFPVVDGGIDRVKLLIQMDMPRWWYR